ncbi:MAG: TonB-dependent receptor [Woeseia sp.]
MANRRCFCLYVTILFVVAFLYLPTAVAQQTDPVVVHIKAQPLADALNSFAEQSGLQLAYLSHVTDDIDSPGTDGPLPPEAALEQLLHGTGLEYKFINAETVVIRQREKSSTPQEPGEDPAESTRPPDGGGARDRKRREDRRPTLEEVIVTGSRIERSGYVTPTPTTVVSGEALRHGGNTRVAAFLTDMPAIGATHTAENSNDDPAESGVGLLDLRRLGIERTLVLVNGRRHVGSRPGTSAIDVNTIPASLVDRIEIITGGASAVYGADAVSGVVNIILDDDIDGLHLRLHGGSSTKGDGAILAASLTAGSDFHDDAGHLYVDLSYDNSGSIDAIDRDHASQSLRFVPNPDSALPNDGISDNVLRANTRFNGTPAGGLPVIDTAGTPLPGGPFTFDSGGRLVPYDPGMVIAGAPALSIGGDGIFLAPFDRLQVPLERLILSGGLRYDLNRHATLFADGKHARAVSETAGQPTFSLTTFVPLFITADNAFIKPDLAAILAGDPDDAADDIPGFFFPRTHVDLGRRLSDSERDTSQLLLGIRGNLKPDWRFEVALQHGRTTNITRLQNNLVDDRLMQAVDAVRDADGRIVCRDPANGCAPLNLLGTGLLSDAAREFVLADIITRGVLEQTIANATVTGQVIELPAGPVGIAAGIEYRKESSETTEGDLRNEGRIFPGGRIENVAGSFDVSEIYGEIVVPLLAGRRFVHASSVEAAVRVANYSTIGTTTTWRFGGDWSPVDGIRLSGMAARAVRAPNIGELFSPAQLQNRFLVDPCDEGSLDAGSPFRRTNCAALGLPPDFQSTAGAITTRVFSGGNAMLSEEEARTVNFGLVVAPPGMPELSVTLDYWNIEITDAVNAFPVQSLVNNCVDLPTISNPFCSFIERDANGQFLAIESSLINIAAQRASGVDFEVGYELPLYRIDERWPGSLHIGAIATYLDALEFQPLAGPETDREAGELGDPRLAGNLRLTYRNRNLTAVLYQRLLGNQAFDRAEPDETRHPGATGTQHYTDLSVRYDFAGRYSIFAGVNNVFDRAPPDIARVPEARAFGEDVALYDAVGRYLYAGVTVRLQ